MGVAFDATIGGLISQLPSSCSAGIVVDYWWCTMGKKYVAFGCSKTHKDNVSLFKFPTDIKLRRAWTLQVKRTRDRWDGPNERSTLCSDHFTVECFESMSILSKEMGLQRRTKLKPNAIPSIFPRPPPASVPSKRPRSSRAFEKREKARVNLAIITTIKPIHCLAL